MKMNSLGQFPTVQDYILVLLFQKKKWKKIPLAFLQLP